VGITVRETLKGILTCTSAKNARVKRGKEWGRYESLKFSDTLIEEKG